MGLLSFSMISGCGKKEEAEEEVVAAATDDDAAVAADEGATFTGAAGIMSAADSTFGSIPASNFSLVSTTCENGEPSGESRDSDGYPGKLFECKATSNSHSPDTISGSIGIVKGMICALEAAVGSIEYTTAGTDLLAAAGGTLTITLTGCFDSSVIDEMGTTTLALSAATATALDPTTDGYQRRLAITASMGDESPSYVVDFFDTGTKAGFKTTEGAASPGKGGITQVTFDFENGIVSYANIDDRNGYGGSDSIYRRNVRVRVEGTISDTDYTYTAITGLQGIYAQSGSSDSYADLSTNFTVVTLKGTSTTGFKGFAYSSDGTTLNQLSSSCTPAGSSCGAGLVPSSGNIAMYIPASSWDTYISAGKPLCTSELTFDAVPETAALAACS